MTSPGDTERKLLERKTDGGGGGWLGGGGKSKEDRGGRRVRVRGLREHVVVIVSTSLPELGEADISYLRGNA